MNKVIVILVIAGGLVLYGYYTVRQHRIETIKQAEEIESIKSQLNKLATQVDENTSQEGLTPSSSVKNVISDVEESATEKVLSDSE